MSLGAMWHTGGWDGTRWLRSVDSFACRDGATVRAMSAAVGVPTLAPFVLAAPPHAPHEAAPSPVRGAAADAPDGGRIVGDEVISLTREQWKDSPSTRDGSPPAPAASVPRPALAKLAAATKVELRDVFESTDDVVAINSGSLDRVAPSAAPSVARPSALGGVSGGSRHDVGSPFDGAPLVMPVGARTVAAASGNDVCVRAVQIGLGRLSRSWAHPLNTTRLQRAQLVIEYLFLASFARFTRDRICVMGDTQVASLVRRRPL